MLPCLCFLVLRYFDNMPEWNVVVLWIYMIALYALNGKDEEALKMRCQALMMGMRPNDFTFSMVLLIFAKIMAYDQGMQVHILTIKYEFDSYDFCGYLSSWHVCKMWVCF